MIKIAIDLLWVKHNNLGGVESYIRNLLDGFITSKDDFLMYLITTIDNFESFKHYEYDKRMRIIKCNTVSTTLKSLFWSNLFLDRLVTSLNVDFCFVPNARKPLFSSSRNKYICTIHDLQALHYPQYFSKIRYLWLKYSIGNLIKTSYRVIAISSFVKNDIINQYKCKEEKVYMIYNPISSISDFCDFEDLCKKYHIERDNYFYTISSLLPHKNTITLLKMMNLQVNEYGKKDLKLLISGIKGNDYNVISQYIKNNKLENNCIYTGFVSDAERNTLMKNASFFLFPSVFEGFGMPIIEAMRLGTKVLTTSCTSLKEVSHGMAIYVNNPFDEKEWVDKICLHTAEKGSLVEFEQYNVDIVAQQYLDFFKTVLRLC